LLHILRFVYALKFINRDIFMMYICACACTRKKRNIREFNNLWIALKTIALKM